MSENMRAEDSSLVEVSHRGRTRRVYPEVAAYLNEYVQIEWDYEDATAEAAHQRNVTERNYMRRVQLTGRYFDRYDNQEDRQAFQAWRETQRQAERAAQTAKAEREARLKEGLVNSPHREVKWIAENALFNGQGGEVEGYARDILAILPATTEQIWSEAKDNRGMCDVFDRMYEQAEAAGIFSDGEVPLAAREMAAMRNWVRRNYGSGYVRDLMTQMDRVMKVVNDAHAEELAKAKAEWQGLDEAWRSERSRRGAATRAANREAQTGDTVHIPVDQAERVVIPQISTQSAMTGEIIRSDIRAEEPSEKVSEGRMIDFGAGVA